MTIENVAITQNGVGAVGPGSLGVLQADADAPNGIVFGATVTVRLTGEVRYLTIDLPIGDYSAYPRLAIILHSASVRAVREFAPVSGLNVFTGSEQAVFGLCAGLAITGYELCAIDSSGRMGFSDGLHAVVTSGDQPGEVELGTAPAFTSAVVAGEAFTKSDGTVLNATGSTTVTITYEQADDAVGSGAAAVVVTGLIAPAGSADKYLRIKREVADPTLPANLIDYSVWTFSAADDADVALGAAPAFTSTLTEGIAFTKSDGTVVNSTGSTVVTLTYQQADDAAGAGLATLTPSGLTLPTTVQAFARVRREVTDPSLGAPLVDFSAWVAVTNLPTLGTAPAFTSALTESTAFTKDDGTTSDTTVNTTVTISYEQADDASGTNTTALTVTGNAMPASVNEFVRIKRVMSDPLLTTAAVGDLTDYSAWTACANASTVPATPVPTFGATVMAYNGTDKYFRAVVTSFSGHVAGDQYEMTTSLLSPIPENQFEFMEPISGGWQTQMDDPAARVDPNTQTTSARTDYSVFRFTGGSPWVLDEPQRGTRLRFRRRHEIAPGVYGPWSLLSEQFTVPLPAAITPTTGWQKRWMPVVIRSREASLIPILDGEGLQFLRSFAVTPARPGLILAAMDQNFQWRSQDGGETFDTPPWNGQWAGRQGISAWIDPTDSNRQIMAYMASLTVNSAAFLSTDGGATCTRVLALPHARGTNSMRHNYQTICHKPGGTPATRTIFILAGLGTAGSATIATIQLYRSTNGGATFSTRGSALSTATYANGIYYPYEIAFNPAGTLMHMCGPNGMRWSDDDGLTWTAATGLPAGAIHHIQYKSTGETWVGTNSGLYSAANGKAFTRVASFGDVNTAANPDVVTNTNHQPCRFFAISPEDDNYIVAAQVGYANPIYSHNGGTSWTPGTSHPRPGQATTGANAVGSSDHGGIVGLHGNRNRFFFHLGQHYGVSTDGGRNTYHAGYLFSGSHARGNLGFHPSLARWGNIAMAGQDYGSMATQNAGVHFIPDDISGTSGGSAGQINTLLDYDDNVSGAGAFIHGSGRVVFSAGIVTGRRVHVIMDQNFTAPGSLGATYVTSNISTLSDNAALDPNSANQGFIGRFRVTNLQAAARADVNFTAMDHHFVTLTGFDGSTVLYGCDGSGTAIYRSDSATPGASWTLWRTATRSFRPVDTRPWFVACQNHAARVYAISGDGFITRIVGATSPTETTIFDARDFVSGFPEYQCRSFAVDPRNPNLGYVSLYMWGCPNVYRTLNLLDATPSWTSIATGDADGLPHIDMELNIHPNTSELFATGPHGTYVCKPPDGHNATYGITNSVWGALDGFIATVQ